MIKPISTVVGHQIKNFHSRTKEYNVECKVAFIVLIFSLVNMFLSILSVVVGGIYLIIKGKAKPLLKETNNLMLLLFLILAFIISLINLNVFGAVATVVMFLCFVIALGLRANINKQIFEDLVNVFLALSVVCFFVAAIERYLFNYGDAMYRCSSTFSNPLYYSYFATFAIIFCVYRLIICNEYKGLHGLIIFFNFYGLLLTGSRMPWIAMFAGVIITICLCRKYKLLIIFLLFFSLLITIAILFPEWKLLAELRLTSAGTAYKGRIPYWKDSLKGIIERPLFGRGFLGLLNDTIKADAQWKQRILGIFGGMSSFENMKSSGWMLHAHNILIDCLYNFGVVGSLVLGFSLLKYSTKMYRNCGCQAYSPYISMFVGLIVTVAVNGIVDCEIVGPQTGVFSVMLIAITGLKEEKAPKIAKTE